MIKPNGYRPIFILKVDGKPFNAARILKIEVTDAAGYESDEMTVVMDDAFPHIQRPREGAKLSLYLGFAEWGAPIFIGTYIFEEWERNGFERTATLIAKAADHSKSIKEPKTRAWEGTFGHIAGTIANEHNLKLVITDDLKAHPIHYAAQTEESDQHFLTRLGRKIGAVVAPKDGHLLVTQRHSGKTAKGEPMPTIHVNQTNLLSDGAYYVRLKPRSKYSKFIANWQDHATGTTKQVILKTGVKGPSFTLRDSFQNEAEARKAATAKQREMRAGEGELSVEILGDPTARAEAPIKVVGVAPDADGDWISSTVTHTWDFGENGGATTAVDAQFGMEEDKKKKTTPKKSAVKGSGEYVSILDR